MKILSLNVQNFLRIEALEIIPKNNSVTITGKNDQGKSSTLRAIDVALGGGKAPDEPIRRGADKSEIVIELGRDKVEAIVKRTYVRRDGKDELATLTVSTPEGARWPKPQDFLDKILGTLSLDPVKFLDMDEEQQAKAVRAFVPGFDFADMEKKNKKDYEDRTEVNRDVKRLEGEVASLPTFTEGWPVEVISTDELVDAIEKAAETNSAIERAKMLIGQINEKVVRHDSAIHSTQMEIDDLEARLVRANASMTELHKGKATAEAEAAEATKAYEAMKPVDVSEAKARLSEADDNNDKAREYRQAETRRGRLSSELEEAKAKSAGLTKAMDDRKTAAAEAIKEAKMPVVGLGFDENGKVTINGFSFKNTAFSKRLMAAIAIAAAHAPELRLIKISEGDKLDDEAQAALAQFAIDHDLQVWQETVQHGEPVGFVIEDGKLKGYAE